MRIFSVRLSCGVQNLQSALVGQRMKSLMPLVAAGLHEALDVDLLILHVEHQPRDQLALSGLERLEGDLVVAVGYLAGMDEVERWEKVPKQPQGEPQSDGERRRQPHSRLCQPQPGPLVRRADPADRQPAEDRFRLMG